MATAQNIVDSLEVHIRDTTNSEVSEAQLLRFLNDAAQDVSNRWWIPLEDDESVSFSAVSVSVPASFAYLREIRYGTNYNSVVPRHYWDVRVDGGVAKVFFDARLTDVSGTLKFVGWKRPKVDYVLADTIEIGIESFLRERAACFAYRFMAAGLSELDRLRASLSEAAFQKSELIVQTHIEERKALPAPRLIPGR